MTSNEKLRRSIDATLREVQIAHLELNVPIEPMDFIEATQIIERIEEKLNRRASDAWNPVLDQADG